MTRTARSVLAGLTAVAFLSSIGACSSSSKSSSDDKTTTTTASSGNSSSSDASGDKGSGDEGAAAADVDPCSLYSKEDMAEQMGATDVTTQVSQGISPRCTYNSEANYLEVQLDILTREQFENTGRDPNAFKGEMPNAGGEIFEVSGIGDDVFGYAMGGGVSLVARIGDTGFSLLLTNAGGGADAGNWVDDAAMITSAKAIMASVVEAYK